MSAAAVYNRIQLRDAVRLAAKVLPGKPTQSLHKCVSIGPEYIVAAGDVESAKILMVPLNDATLKATVVASELLARLDATDQEDVTLDQNLGSLHIKTKRSKWSIPATSDVQKGPVTKPADLVEIETAQLRNLVEAVLPAAGMDPAEPKYYGVAIYPDGRFIATEGRRIHSFSGGPKVAAVTVITPQFAKLLLGLKTEKIRAHFGDVVTIVADQATLTHRHLGSSFAPVDKLIDMTWKALEKGGHVATFSSTELVAAIDAAGVGSAHNQVTMKQSGDVLVVTGRDSGDVSECELTGKLHTVASAAPYLKQAIQALDCETVDMRTSDAVGVGIVFTRAGAKPGSDCTIVAQTMQASPEVSK